MHNLKTLATFIIITLLVIPFIHTNKVRAEPNGAIVFTSFMDAKIVDVSTGQVRVNANYQGEYVVDSSGHKAIYQNNEGNLVFSDIDGSNVINITNDPNSFDVPVGWSPDNSKVLYYKTSDYVHTDLYVLYLADGSSQRITDSASCAGAPYISWFPDNERILCKRYDLNSNIRYIDVVNLSGQILSTITNPPDEEWESPLVSYDGTKIAFRSYLLNPTSPPNCDVSSFNIMNVDGTGRKIAYSNNCGVWLDTFVWSPDGKKIAFQQGSYDGEDADLMVINIDEEAALPHSIYRGPINRVTRWLPVSVDWDNLAPDQSTFNWSQNPKAISQSTSMTVHATDDGSGVAAGEYFIGDDDPGQGNGATMTLTNQQTNGNGIVTGADLTTTFGADFPTGVYKINVRAQDVAGNWSDPASDYLVVYDANGPKFKGKRTIVASLTNGDVLPGLIANDQTDKATFGFVVKYTNAGQISANSDFQFGYSTGTKCNNPSKAVNCHDMSFNATHVDWFTTQGVNNSTGIFQGVGTLTVDGQDTTVKFRVTGRDGERLDPIASDQFELRMFNEADSPNTASPMYVVYAADIARGNIKLVY